MGKKLSFTFNTFSNGLSNDPQKWKTHGYYAAGLDLIGIKDIAGNPIGGRINAPQLAQSLKKDAISASTIASADYHLTGLVEWIKRWDAVSAGNLYAFVPQTSSSNTGLILVNAGGNTTWVSAKTTSAGTGGGGLAALSATMYYGQDTVLGQITSAAVYTNNFATFTVGATNTPRPMKVFAGVLNIGNNNLIATVDATGAFTAAALTLPSGFVVRSLEVLGNYLVISADNGAVARIFLWSGGSATYNEVYDLPELNAPALVAKEGRVFAIGNQIYQLGETSYETIYAYSYFGRGNAST